MRITVYFSKLHKISNYVLNVPQMHLLCNKFLESRTAKAALKGERPRCAAPTSLRRVHMHHDVLHPGKVSLDRVVHALCDAVGLPEGAVPVRADLDVDVDLVPEYPCAEQVDAEDTLLRQGTVL